jgi:hypothetical protein
MMEDDVLALKPLHRVRCEGSLFGVCIQTRTLLGDDSTGVVLQVEQVPHVLGQVRALEVEMQAGDVTHGEVALTQHSQIQVRIFSVTSSTSLPMTAPLNGATGSEGISTQTSHALRPWA